MMKGILSLDGCENVELLLKLAEVFAVLFLGLLDIVQSVVALLQLLADEVNTLGDVLLAVVEALLHEDRSHDFVDLKWNRFRRFFGMACGK